ncbi:MAG: ABC transporter substrate-binding protein [Desulfobacter sp.]|nr:MAG: ABC transporter substrate-binding protein [Desulfobacter sp.]
MSKKIIVSVICLGLLAAAPAAWAKKFDPPLKKADLLIAGERVMDIAAALGVAPRAFVGRYSLWEGGGYLGKVTQLLGCPVKACKKSPSTVPNALERMKIHQVIIEKSPEYCLYKPGVSPECIRKGIEGRQGLTIDTVDFSQGLEAAVTQTASLLGVSGDRAAAVMDAYRKDMEIARQNVQKVAPGKRVVILTGTFQKSTGKSFLRVEAAGGYTDKYLLAPLKAENVGDAMAKNAKRAKGHFTIRKLGSLAAVNPDIIVITGDAPAVHKALNRAVAKHPRLAGVNALKNSAVYVLPAYRDCGPLEYPDKLNKWACMFR